MSCRVSAAVRSKRRKPSPQTEHSTKMWLVLTLIFFVAFLASLFGVARIGFDATGKFQKSGKFLIGSAAISLVIWLFALSRVPPPYPLEELKNYKLPK